MRARFPAILLVLPGLLVLSSGAVGSGAMPQRGDVTCDGSLGLRDVTELLQRAAGLETHIGCSVSSSSGTIFYTYPGEADVAPGEAFVVSVFADVSGSLGSWGIDVQFNPMVIDSVSCEPIGSTGCNTISPNTIRLAGAVGGANGLRGTQHFGDIEFMAVGNADATSALQLTVSAFNAQGVPVASVTSAGSIMVASDAEPLPRARVDYWPTGDVNCDSEVSALDALLLTERLALGQNEPITCIMQ